MKDVLSRWWLVVIQGIAAVLFGIGAFVVPGAALGALVLVYGIYALVDGVTAVGVSLAGSRGGMNGWMLLGGLVSIVAGAVALLYPGLTATALLYLIAFWAIFTGAMRIVAAIELRKAISGEFWLALGGVASILFGVLCFAWPQSSALAIVWLIGAYALVLGVSLIAVGFRMRGVSQELSTATA